MNPADQFNQASYRLSRRRLVQVGAGIGVGAVATPLLLACGSSNKATSTSGGGSSSGSTAASGTQASGSGGTPKSGGKLSMSLSDADVKSFDPIIPTDNMSIWTMLLIYDQLVRVGADGTSLEPGLAEKWEAATDNLTFTFNLRDAKFHDGSAATADDCTYSLDRAAHDKDSQWSWLFAALDKLDASDSKTVKITLKEAWAPFLADCAIYGASIIPKALHTQKQAALFDAPVGTGPFKFDSWDKTNQVVLKKSDVYWEDGKPYLDELDFFVLTDANTRMLKFQAGELDIATDVPFSQLESLKANANYQILTDGAARFDYIAMNNTRAPFDDKNLRQAINYAIDKDSIIKTVLFGYGKPANTMLPIMLYHADDVIGYPFDLSKAQDLLSKSSAKDGFKAELIVSSGDPVGQQVAQLIKDQLTKIKGDITIRLAEPGSATDEIHALNYDWSKSYYTTDIIDPDELATFGFVSTGGAQSVWTGYKNDQVDQLALKGESETDESKRKDIYHQMQEMSTDDAPVIFLYYPTGRTALQKHVNNFHILPTGNYRMWEVWRS